MFFFHYLGFLFVNCFLHWLECYRGGVIPTSFCIYYLKSAKIVVSPRNVLSYIHEVFMIWPPEINLIKNKTNGHTNVEEKYSRCLNFRQRAPCN